MVKRKISSCSQEWSAPTARNDDGNDDPYANFIQEIECMDVKYEVNIDGSKTLKLVPVGDVVVTSVETNVKESDFIFVDDFVDQENEPIAKKAKAPALSKSETKKSGKKKSKKIKLLAEEISLENEKDPATDEQLPAESVDDMALNPDGPDMHGWNEFGLAIPLLSGLQALGFVSPTEIQSQALPLALAGRDVLGAAQTGSGKTLAFGLPILNHIISSDSPTDCFALILVPIVSIVGGLSHLKQRRQLSANPNIIVATPGRLWDLCQEESSLLDKLRSIKFLVLDEADRMLESGHFKDLDCILAGISLVNASSNDFGQETANKINEIIPVTKTRQTLLFSATLIPESKKIHDNGRRKKVLKKKRDTLADPQIKTESGDSIPTIADLVKRIEFSDPSPVYINLVSSESVTAEGIFESKINCLIKDKDFYLYYILIRYPGKTLVFVNSIDSIRRLVPLLELLGLTVWGIHAEMQQRQRMKNLERFKEAPHGILVSSDVSARGLDIPLVDHVLHYQLPRTPDLYVHRSGRTARGVHEGVVVALCAPAEVKAYRRICHALERTEEMADFPIDYAIMGELKERVLIARAIDDQEHRLQKLGHELSWLKKTAEDAELSFDEDVDDEDLTQVPRKNVREKIKSLRYQLKTKLAQTLIPKGVSRKYITSGGMAGLGLNSASSLPSILIQNKKAGSNTLAATKSSSAIDDLKAKILLKIKKAKISSGQSTVKVV